MQQLHSSKAKSNTSHLGKHVSFGRVADTIRGRGSREILGTRALLSCVKQVQNKCLKFSLAMGDDALQTHHPEVVDSGLPDVSP